jgi:hypothetical protein
MPMAKGCLRLGDALLHRSSFLCAQLRDFSCKKHDGKSKADANYVNSNHGLLFHDPPTSVSAEIAPVSQIWGDRWPPSSGME